MFNRVLWFGGLLSVMCSFSLVMAEDDGYRMNPREKAVFTDTKGFVEAGGDVNKPGELGRSRNRLHTALLYGYTSVARVLVESKADVNAKDELGTTPLHWAVRSKSGDLARLLIARGARVSAKDKYGTTPLHYCATGGDEGGRSVAPRERI